MPRNDQNPLTLKSKTAEGAKIAITQPRIVRLRSHLVRGRTTAPRRLLKGRICRLVGLITTGIWTDLSSVLSQFTRVTDRETDGQTDGQNSHRYTASALHAAR